MNLYRDKQVRNYGIFLLFFVLLLFLTGIALCANQTERAKNMLISHDRAIAESLLEQGVSEVVAAAAITNTESSKAGADFLAVLGITEETADRFLPFLAQFQQSMIHAMLITGVLLTLLILGGTFIFLWKRECLYQRAANMVSNFIDGDYSYRLPQISEGTIYQIFASVEQLATMLQAKNETEHRVKEFLKSTISDISHQLKTPLAALTMYQEIIENEWNHPETVKEFTEKIGISLKRMEQLIQSMLKITRLDAGNIVFDKSCFQISELIIHSRNELVTRAVNEKKEIVLNGTPDGMLFCDKNWTSEAIGNIIKNALDHTDSGGVIHISWEYSPAMIRIIISDNGKGIPPEDIHHIFKRFYRSKKSLDTQGVGLGLPLAKSIIEEQGGIISVQSNLEEGTVFTISFLTEV